jgi:hypothetical protein
VAGDSDPPALVRRSLGEAGSVNLAPSRKGQPGYSTGRATTRISTASPASRGYVARHSAEQLGIRVRPFRYVTFRFVPINVPSRTNTMRHLRRHLTFLTNLTEWRRAAQTLALLALLANAVLLPALHFAAGGPSVTPVHSVAVFHHHSRDNNGEKEPAGTSHQVCHFCRLLGVALPPPPAIVIEIVSASQIVRWSIGDQSIRWRQPLRTANLPRAPPSMV